jgi:hypothetical protein
MIKKFYFFKIFFKISSSSIPLIGVLHIEVRCMPSKSIELRGFLVSFFYFFEKKKLNYTKNFIFKFLFFKDNV